MILLERGLQQRPCLGRCELHWFFPDAKTSSSYVAGTNLLTLLSAHPIKVIGYIQFFGSRYCSEVHFKVVLSLRSLLHWYDTLKCPLSLWT